MDPEVAPEIHLALANPARDCFSARHMKRSRVAGRPARSAPRSTAGVRLWSLLLLGGLLVLPVFALHRRGVDWRWAGAYAFAVSALTLGVYALDKRRAQAGEWRVPESTLHLLELAGGWPGGWLAQQWFRHKCAKGSFLVVFWLIVCLWQFAAWDSLEDFRLSRTAWERVRSTLGTGFREP